MINSYEFLKSIIDTIAEHIVVVDKEANIRFVNYSWLKFAENNSCLIRNKWEGVNYLKICNQAANMGDEVARQAAEGITKVINCEQESFYLEYPCHSTEIKRWFIMRITPFLLGDSRYYVISHQNITERKIAEEKILEQSRLDGLTDIPNRRYFDEFLSDEWKRCARLKMPLTLVMIDIDHFKLFNDTYGHQAGDECLKTIAIVLKEFAKRPGDLCARYGGEEFSLVLGNTDTDESLDIARKLLEAIRGLRIQNDKAPTAPIVTASIGIDTMFPNNQDNEKDLIKSADLQLYAAKGKGRNQFSSRCCQ